MCHSILICTIPLLHAYCGRDDELTIVQLHEQTSLHEKIFELSGDQEKLQSANAVLDSQVVRLKAEKKQLKAYALQLKEKAEGTEAAFLELQGKKSSLENLLAEIAPLSEELRNQLKILEKMKNKYISEASSGSGGIGLSEELVEATDVSMFSATNSADSADMLSEFAALKGFVANKTAQPARSSPSKQSTTTATSTDGTKGAQQRERAESDDIFASMKNTFKNFGDAIFE
jgi:hypothetical protein